MSAQLKDNNFLELEKMARTDPVIGTRMIKMTGDDPGGPYVAELGLHRNLTAHYHHPGSVIYQIVHGEGKIPTGVPTSDDIVVWNTSLYIRSGDRFSVQEGQVHQLENSVSLPMITVIVCPVVHTVHDRFIVQGAH